MDCIMARINNFSTEREKNFCRRLQTSFAGENCTASFKISSGTMKFFIRFNYEPMHPIKDVLRILNEELEKKLISEGWDHFFIRENKAETIRGNFC